MEDLNLIFPYVATDLTEQINVIPNLYGMINELDIFPSEGSISRIIEMRYENEQLRVLPAKERGASGTPVLSATGQSIFLEIPHFPSMDEITPEDIQDILIQIGKTKRPITVAEETAKRLIRIKRNHDITREWVRAGALQGLIQDGNSSTIYNLYTVFGIANTTVDFLLGTTTTDINGKCASIWKQVTTNLKGETMNGIEAIVDPDFFEAFVTHANVEKYYLQAEQALQLTMIARKEREGQMWGREFRHQRILFREYYGTAPVKTSPTSAITNTAFWPSKTGTCYPVGTADMFRTYDAPAHDLRFVNTIGNEIYVSPKFKDHGEGLELKSESNCLAICRRPAATVQIFSSN